MNVILISPTDTWYMKTLCILFFTVSVTLAVAEDTIQRTFSGIDSVKKNAKVTKSTRAYRKAKEECLKSSGDLKGKKLTDCIVDYQKEAK
jgi:hypothetical protein